MNNISILFQILILFISSYFISSTTASTSSSTCFPFIVHIPSFTYNKTSHILSFVLPEFSNAHPCVTIISNTDDISSLKVLRKTTTRDDSTTTTVITINYIENTTRSAEAYDIIHHNTSYIQIITYGKLAVAYALHKLREHLLLYPTKYVSPSPYPSSSPLTLREHLLLYPTKYVSSSPLTLSIILEQFPASSSPVYSLRTISEEGQLLDIPDRSYYTEDYNHFNISLLQEETLLLEYEIVPAILRLQLNSLTILHSDLEDYVNYDTLNTFIPNAPIIYPSNDPHRTRQADLISIIAPWVEHLTNDYGIAVYFQPYEFSSPNGICNNPKYFNCTLGSPDIGNILKARYTEFFAAVPSCAGIVATVTDSWSPRANYTFVTLWSTTAQLAEVATIFYDAIVTTGQKDLVFRLWVLGQTVDWPTLRDNTPPGVEFSVKQTEGDFLLDYPINNLLNSTAPSEKRFMVLVDAFRQYNGWTSSVCYMGAQWQRRLAIAVQNGVKDLNIWGSWAPGCTWPDSGGSLGNYSQSNGYKSWRGYWNSYRMFNGSATNGGFSLNGQANSYLIYRLAWNSTTDPLEIAADFGTLYFGEENSPYVVTILNASFYAWYQTSEPETIGDFTLFWTMMSHSYSSLWLHLVNEGVTVGQCTLAGNISASYITIMENALSLINPNTIPSTNPNGYQGLTRAVNIARDYLAAVFAWREAGIRNITLGNNPTSDQCTATKNSIITAQNAIVLFGQRYPLEDHNWAVYNLGEELYSAPTFLTNTQYRTMYGWIEPWLTQVNMVCK